MNKIILQGYILVPAAELDAVSNALEIHKTLTMEESGCVVFDVTQSTENPLRFFVYEEFVDQQAFEYHQNRVKASDWGKVSQNVSRHYSISKPKPALPKQINLRIAEHHDAEALAQLTLLAGGDFFPMVFGSGAQRLLVQSFQAEPLISSYQHAQVVLAEDDIAGMVHGFSYQQQVQDDGKADELFSKLAGIRLPWLYIIMSVMPEWFGKAFPGQFLINALAVFPSHRRMGVASQLLEAASRKATELGANTLALDVDADNKEAIELYLAFGFKVTRDESINLFGFPLWNMFRLEKTL